MRSLFLATAAAAVDWVNPLIGNAGDGPNNSGGMIPSTAPPFAMTRWVPQTRQNYVSVTPYNYSDNAIHGFLGTHQPAIWMGESAPVVVVPGAGTVKDLFEQRGMLFSHHTELAKPCYYRVQLDAIEGGTIFAEQSATSRVGHLRFTFSDTQTPYILLQATRPSVIGSSDPSNVTFPIGTISIDPISREITGTNPERQDFVIGPLSTPASSFRGYFCARFDVPFLSYGTANNGTLHPGESKGNGTVLSAYATFQSSVVNVRIGVSFISVEQARRNLDKEIPDGQPLEDTANRTRELWEEKLGRIRIEGASDEEMETFYTAFFHTLQYPNEQSEDGMYYSGYDDAVHHGISYTGYSIWDTYRAEWAWLILFAPERVPGMIQSMLQDYVQGGWLPMWKNIIETNIMVGTHADSLIAEAVIKGITDFDLDLAYEAVYKDATVPPIDDLTTSYYDREESVDYEVRAGLSSVYAEKGWVAADFHAESASRTLAYAYDDYALSVLSTSLHHPSNASFFLSRALTAPFTLFNPETGFMQARYANGSWAGQGEEGWTEGDQWCYSFDVVHDVPGLVERRGGKEKFVQSLEAHFEGGHNDHTNEPSHHVPYLYSLAGAASKTQERVREIAKTNYNNTVNGLAGNEDCGQMSAWYLFSALGFYPVNPVSGEYVVGSPFYDKVTIHLPDVQTQTQPHTGKPLVITSRGAPTNVYVKSLTIDGELVHEPILKHEQIVRGGVELVFEMSDRPQWWASDVVVGAVSTPKEEYLGHEEL